jgi:glycosyltransferase involved in cell wall biosynthesis
LSNRVENRSRARRPRLVVFSDDWGRHPSSCQHLILRLLPRYDVDWINTIGMRRPRLAIADFRRGAEKLRSWVRPGAASSEARDDLAEGCGAPVIHSPILWPSFGSRWGRAANRRLLLNQLDRVLRGPSKPLAVITTVPIVADLARATGDLNWRYYCVDDFSEWPNLDKTTMGAMERDLIASVRSSIAASEVLRERLAVLGIRAPVLTHGVDLDRWRAVGSPRPLNGGRPTALFWGLADARLDVDICLALAESCRLRIVGPRSDVDRHLLSHPSIFWEGPVSFDELPDCAGNADVLVMPYRDMAVTRAMQPLKLKEYLATRLPVVATPLPANLPWADAMDVTSDAAEFAAICLKRAGSPLPAGQATARQRLEYESWDAKAQVFERWLLEPEYGRV